MKILKEKQTLVIAFLVFLGAFSRLLPHKPNFSPLTALALFAAVYLGRKTSLIIPLLAMLASDIFLGFYDAKLMAFVYGSFALTVALGWLLKKKKWLAVSLGSFLGSVIFFLLTNFAVWFFYEWYPKTAFGLWDCYLQALPFFKNTLLSSFVFSFSFFGVFELLKRFVLAEKKEVAL